MDSLRQDSQPDPLDPDASVCLRHDIIIEPLFYRWWAWPHLLSPVQSALNIAFRYLPLLQSFVSKPSIHISATKDPRLFGGPFVHLSLDDVPKARDLIAMTQQRFSRLLELANDLKSFDLLLQDHLHGTSLNDTYAAIPRSLAGMIELMYDIHNHPKVHLLEELLYSEYGSDLRRGGQEISLSRVKESTRRFFMSTPRLESTETLTITTAYSDPALDVLSEMRWDPLPLRELHEKLPAVDFSGCYREFFTVSSPGPVAADYGGDDVRVRYFGHACVLIQTSKTSILIDPTFGCDLDTLDSSPCSRLTIKDLPHTIDYVILTHCHQDHFCPEALLQIRSRVRTVVIPANNRGSVVDPSMRLSLKELGFHSVVSQSHFDQISIDGGRLVSIPFPGEHGDLEVYSKQSLYIELRGRRLMFLVDSDGRDAVLYQRIARKILGETPVIDALFLGMECHGAPLTWLYGPLLSKPIARVDDESRRLSGSNCKRALHIIRQFNCARVYVYAMGQEPWLRYLMGLEYGPESIQLTESSKLVNHCRANGMVAERLHGSQDILI
jgi:L-ascorbate metabolism protein UlaG (beta-lactamase superfamily)